MDRDLPDQMRLEVKAPSKIVSQGRSMHCALVQHLAERHLHAFERHF